MRRVWLRVSLTAGAGLVSLAVCSGAFVVISALVFSIALSMGDFFGLLGSPYLNPVLSLLGIGIALLVAVVSLSLPALALGARGGHLRSSALLSGLGFCAFVFFLFESAGEVASVLFTLTALAALVATPVIGSLVAVREEGPLAVRLGRASVIGAVAIYCASLLAWSVYGGQEGLPYSYAPVIVGSSSWLVVPGIVALLRPG
jgi:hypothetical protein